MQKTLDDYTADYTNTEAANNALYADFTKNTDNIDYLKQHRDYIEVNKLGFGERAFQYMWYILLKHLAEKKSPIKALEIGVFKGQIISLWSLIGKNENFDVDIYGITPLSGNPQPKNKWLFRIKSLFSKKLREDLASGNFYEDEDYKSIIEKLFLRFNLDFDRVNLEKGFSTDKPIIEKHNKLKFDVIYVDGDHSLEGAKFDILNYSALINIGGFLVIDDAACNIPGSSYWKGHQSVSDAAEFVNQSQFKNILNIGHNRIYQRIND